MTHPRVHTKAREEVPLNTHQAFQDPTLVTQAALERMLCWAGVAPQTACRPSLE